MALAGPWWNELTYKTERPAHEIEPGVRVIVPVGAGTRVAVVLGVGGSFDGEIREISSFIDASPLLTPIDLELLRWFTGAYLCGIGTAMKTLLPSLFMQGDDVLAKRGASSADLAAAIRRELAEDRPRTETREPDLLYDPLDDGRYAAYAEIAARGERMLVCCPTKSVAARVREKIAASSPDPSRVMLYPATGAKAEWRAWCAIAAGEADVVVGSQQSATAPLRGLRRIVVEDESSAVWRSSRAPLYNVRSLLSMRARIEGAALTLAGRMPSARAFAKVERDAGRGVEVPRAAKGKKVFFVDMKLAYKPGVELVESGLAISEPLVRETSTSLDAGRWAIWVLDRRGYAGEISCVECGAAVVCPRCGGAMRWEARAGRVKCVVCGATDAVPSICPSCGGPMLTAKRPGIEAIPTLARAALGDVPVVTYGEGAEVSGEPGVVVGTRAALELLDTTSVGLVAWLDADGEARREEHDARARAFGLIWESMWRGVDPADRQVLLQTRRPAKDWQRGLSDVRTGWRAFWRDELDERRDFGMPPFASLVKVDGSRRDVDDISSRLSVAGVDHWADAGPARGTVWIRVARASDLRRILEPIFHISRARVGFPKIEVWHD